MTRHFLLALSLVGILTAAGGQAAETTRLVPGGTSKLVLEGSSNVAPWRCSGSTLDGRMEVAASLHQINSVIDRIEDGNIGVWLTNPAAGRFPQPAFELAIRVDTLRCGNGRMERDLQRALHAPQHPSIRFRFQKLVGGVTHDIDSGRYHATVAGQLSMAGAARTITLEVVAERLARDRFRLRAVLPLRMTDFGVTPPTALFGAIKARDDVKVSFDLLLQVAKPGAGT